MSHLKSLALALAFFASITAGCRAEPESNRMTDQFIEPIMFAAIQVGEGLSTCTPTKPSDPEWQGIVISAPTLVRVTRHSRPAMVPICVTAVLPIIAPETPEILLVAVDRNTGKRYVGSAFTRPSSSDDSVPNPWPQPALQAHEVAGVTAGVSFNTNLAAALQLPTETGDYDVHMERGALKSNTQTIRLEFPN